MSQIIPYLVQMGSTIIGVDNESILRLVLERYRVSEEEFFGKTKPNDIVRVRFMYTHLCMKYTPMGVVAIAKILKRDHSTVSKNYLTIRNTLMIYDKKFLEEIQELEYRIDPHNEVDFRVLRISGEKEDRALLKKIRHAYKVLLFKDL